MALSFGGTDSHANTIHYGDVDALDAQAAYTWGWYGNLLDTPVATRQFFRKYIGGGPNDGYVVQMTSTGYLAVVMEGFAATFTAGQTTTASGWRHYAIAYDGSTIKLYINGAFIESQALAVGTPTANAQNFYIGGNAGVIGLAMDAHTIRVWNVALNANEMFAAANGGSPQHDNLRLWTIGNSTTQKDLIIDAAPTVGGTVTIVGAAHRGPAVPTSNGPTLYPGVFTLPVYKVIDEAMGLAEAVNYVRNQYKILSETGGITEAIVRFPDYVVKVTDEGVTVEDGTSTDDWSPDGMIARTMSDGTIWYQKYPPFLRKTQWTSGE